ncbi:hypothetical protein RNZ50_22450 [Paracoccaceae bacterium Fryx2]|nr:hypothetical protein [Paracoccaceae bacterium Fryx2]
MRSSLEIWNLKTGTVSVVLKTDLLIEAPNWDPAGDSLMVNGSGRLWRVPLATPRLEAVDTDFATTCNNDHGFSRDGRMIALSNRTDRGSEIFVMPAGGGVPRAVTQHAPSWFHGWSPDGRRLTYVAARGESRVVDVYSIAVEGGEETRLTNGEGHSDGPEYSADGAHIYYNCDRTGHAQIWRMAEDGSGQERLFEDSYVNWFPHPSPDGKHVVYLAFPPFTEGHPRDLHVGLKLVDPDGRNVRTLMEFHGGQGSLNAPSWAPDGSAFALVHFGTQK